LKPVAEKWNRVLEIDELINFWNALSVNRLSQGIL
jgi:hypothetical protein